MWYLSKHSLTDFYLFSFHAQDLPCHFSLIELKCLFFWVSCRLKRVWTHYPLFPQRSGISLCWCVKYLRNVLGSAYQFNLFYRSLSSNQLLLDCIWLLQFVLSAPQIKLKWRKSGESVGGGWKNPKQHTAAAAKKAGKAREKAIELGTDPRSPNM